MLQQNTKIIAIANQKGGVAKTTTATNLSAALALAGLKVMLIDLDPQGNASTGLGIENSNRKNTIYQVLTGTKHINESIYQTTIKNLDIIPANINLSAAEIELLSLPNKENILKKSISTISAKKYNYIIIDCPPSLGQLTFNALTAANSILIPMQCEFFALEGLSYLLRSIDIVQKSINKDLKILGVVLSMYDKRNRLSEQVAQDVRNCLGEIVFNTIIPRNVRISEAPSHGMPVISYDPNCAGTKAYHALAEELLQRERLIL